MAGALSRGHNLSPLVSAGHRSKHIMRRATYGSNGNPSVHSPGLINLSSLGPNCGSIYTWRWAP